MSTQYKDLIQNLVDALENLLLSDPDSQSVRHASAAALLGAYYQMSSLEEKELGRWLMNKGGFLDGMTVLEKTSPYFQEDRETFSRELKNIIRRLRGILSEGAVSNNGLPSFILPQQSDAGKALTTFDYGPCYNPLDSNGLPILGQWLENPLLKHQNTLSDKPRLNAFIPQSGAVLLKGLSVDREHRIIFNLGYAHDLPALLLAEDFDTAIALIFNQEDAVSPEFDAIKTNEGDIYKKIWNPTWLGETDFGRTLYACHQFITALVFSAKDFQLASPEKFYDRHYYTAAEKMLEELVYLQGKNELTHSSCKVRIKPVEGEAVISGHINNENPLHNSWKIKTENMALGYEVYNFSTSEKADPVTSFLNYNREAIPNFMPVFERLNQLLALWGALSSLKRAGYILPAEERDYYRKIQIRYEDMAKNNSAVFFSHVPLKNRICNL